MIYLSFIDLFTYASMHLCLYVCIYVYIYVYMYFVCMYVCMYACMYVCMYVCMNETILLPSASCLVNSVSLPRCCLFDILENGSDLCWFNPIPWSLALSKAFIELSNSFKSLHSQAWCSVCFSSFSSLPSFSYVNLWKYNACIWSSNEYFSICHLTIWKHLFSISRFLNPSQNILLLISEKNWSFIFMKMHKISFNFTVINA